MELARGGVIVSNEEVKRWLIRYSEARQTLDRAVMEYEAFMALQESAKGVQYSDMPKAFDTEHDLSDLMVKRDRYLTRIIKARTRAEKIMGEIIKAIDQLPNEQEKNVISARYLQLQGCRLRQWEEVCVMIKYAWSQTHMYHAQALRDLADIIKSG